MYETRKAFLQEIKRLAGLKSLEEADFIAQTVIGLIKARIGPKLSEQIADSVSEDLAMGWRGIALPSEAMELQEMMFELEETEPYETPYHEEHPAEYG
jgi:uncharacterized protein (DUF2267 family)